MLAQSFKTAQELGLTNHEFESLVSLLGMLERGEFKYIPHESITSDIWPPPDKELGTLPIPFNMGNYYASSECGTVVCLAGASDSIFDTRFVYKSTGAYEQNKLYDLFHPSVQGRDEVTPDEAAIALRNFLTLGDPRWVEIIGE